jgi:hypothetical protein
MRAESEGAPLEVDRPGEPDSGTLHFDSSVVVLLNFSEGGLLRVNI